MLLTFWKTSQQMKVDEKSCRFQHVLPTIKAKINYFFVYNKNKRLLVTTTSCSIY